MKKQLGEMWQRNLNVWANSSEVSALDRLAAAFQLSRGDALAKIISEADNRFQSAIGIDCEDWGKYWNKTLHVTDDKG